MEEPSRTAGGAVTHRRRYQFDLKHLLLLFVACAAVLGWLHQRSRLAMQAKQIQDAPRRIAVLELGAIVRGDMTDEQKRVAIARYVRAGDAEEEVTKRLGKPGEVSRVTKSRSYMCEYHPLAADVRAEVYWDGNIFLVFDDVDGAIAVGYYGPVQGNVRYPVSLGLRQAPSLPPQR